MPLTRAELEHIALSGCTLVECRKGYTCGLHRLIAHVRAQEDVLKKVEHEATRGRADVSGKLDALMTVHIEKVKELEDKLAAAERERDEFERKLWSARFAMSQANDALESDADLDARRAAFERIQEEFEDVSDEEFEAARAALAGGTDQGGEEKK